MADAGTSFTIDIEAKAESAAQAAVLVERLTSQLDDAKKAAKAASDAVKEGNSAYTAAETAAKIASTALEKLNIKIDEQRVKVAKLAAGSDGVVNVAAYRKAAEALTAMSNEQTKLAQASAQATVKMNTQAAALDRLKGQEKDAAGQVDKLTKAQTAAKKASEAFKAAGEEANGSGKVNEAAEAFGKLGGPLGAIGQKAFGAASGFQKMAGSLGSAGPYVAVAVAIVAIATAVATVTAAVVVGVASITKWAVGLADAARSQGLLFAGITKSVQGGKLLADAIDTIQARVPLTTDELSELAKPLAQAGLKGGDLKEALQTAAIAAAKVKFGPDFQKELNSLPSLTARLQQNFSRIFSGLKIEALLEALSKIVDLFNKDEATAKAIKVVFESLFQPLVDGITAFVPKMISAFIQFEILVLKALIAIKPFGSKIQEVAIAFGILAGIVALMTVGFMVAVIAPFAIIAGLAVAVIIAVRQVAQGFQDLYDKLTSMSLSEIGTQMMQGLADGITGAAGAVVGAITGAVQGAIDSAKKLLKIASPSKVFAEIGSYTAEGMAGGVDDGAGDVQKSLEDMVAPPDAKPGAAGASTGGKGGAPVYNFTFNGVAGAEDALSRFVEALRMLNTAGGQGAPTNA